VWYFTTSFTLLYFSCCGTQDHQTLLTAEDRVGDWPNTLEIQQQVWSRRCWSNYCHECLRCREPSNLLDGWKGWLSLWKTWLQDEAKQCIEKPVMRKKSMRLRGWKWKRDYSHWEDLAIIQHNFHFAANILLHCYKLCRLFARSPNVVTCAWPNGRWSCVGSEQWPLWHNLHLAAEILPDWTRNFVEYLLGFKMFICECCMH